MRLGWRMEAGGPENAKVQGLVEVELEVGR